MSSRHRWRKVWTDLWATPTLMHVGDRTLGLFVMLVVHATWEPGDDEARMLVGGGMPMSKAVISRISRMPPKALNKSLKELQAAGAIDIREGVIVLPNYAKWQESADAARKRRVRGQSGPASAESPSASASPSPSPSSTSPGLRPAPDDDDRDDPEIRGIGTAASRTPCNADTALQLLSDERQLFAADLSESDRLRLPTLVPDGRTSDGVQRALNDYGWDVILAVFRHAMRRVVAGAVDPKFFACMFHGGGFGAHLEAYRVDVEREERRAKNFGPREPDPEPSGPEVTPEAAAAAAARFRTAGATT